MLRKFERKLRTKDMGKRTETVVAALGVGGQTARGIVFGIVGGFFIDAALSYDPGKAQGLEWQLKIAAGLSTEELDLFRHTCLRLIENMIGATASQRRSA